MAANKRQQTDLARALESAYRWVKRFLSSVQSTIQARLGKASVAEPGEGLASAAVQQAYLQDIARTCSALPWPGPDKPHLTLSDVVVPPQVKRAGAGSTDGVEFGAACLPALRAAAEAPRMVLLGDPGAGKSTFVRSLALHMARAILDPGRDTPGWPGGPLFPLLVELRAFGASAHNDGTADGLWRYVVDEVGPLAPNLRRRMTAEGGVLVLFDGLDEVRGEDRRTLVRDAVVDFCRRYTHPPNRYLVTCDSHAYLDPRWQFPDGFEVYVLDAWSEDRIAAFCEAWYGRARPRRRAERIARLHDLARSPQRAGLAAKPLLLTWTAMLVDARGYAPADRMQLYAAALELLVERWRREASGPGEPLDLEGVEALLERAAWSLAPGETLADRLQEMLSAEPRAMAAEDASRAISCAMSEGVGLLVERSPGAIRLPHPTLETYLASAHLGALPDFKGRATGLLSEDRVHWRPAVLLAIGILARVKRLPHLAEAAVAAICPNAGAPQTPAGQQAVKQQKWYAAWLAGEALLELGDPDPQRQGKEGFERVRGWIGAMLQVGALSGPERVAAGRTLAALGDHRPGVGLRSDGLPDVAWCDVPSGEVAMPDEEGEQEKERSSERKTRVAAFCIARYPVTQAQYAAFVRDGGYTETQRACWSDAGWTSRGAQPGPQSYGGAFDLPNHPVVGVSCYEAAAFCRWLTGRLRASRALDADAEIVLPTEAQWERAARGDDGRPFPWGAEPAAGRCNCAEAGLGTTSAVGCFPEGASPCGALDMAGNTWEWCRSALPGDQPALASDQPASPGDREPDAQPALRGGAMNAQIDDLRCTRRLVSTADARSYNLGFRLARQAVPTSPSGGQ